MSLSNVQFAPAAGMRIVKAACAVLAASLLLAACSGSWAIDYSAPVDPQVARNVRVSAVQVLVPKTLTVSNEDTFTPNADIVWHDDVPGDRRQQIKAVLETAAKRAVAPLRGGRSATFNITVTEFHGVTPKAVTRAPGAVYNIGLIVQLVDSSGNALTPPTPMRADLAALVGEAALAEAQRGRTQKTRVINHLDAVFKSWLGIGPDIRGTFKGVGR